MTGELLFLGYDEGRTGLMRAIRARGWGVTHRDERVEDLSAWDLVVSFGYRHILKPATLASARRPPLNLHISYLPHNRGAHPNFWAHIEGAPSGVTIHEIDAGVDTGPICFQRRVAFAPEEITFASTHARLIAEAEALFIANIDALLGGDYEPRAQEGGRAARVARELPSWMTDWNMTIEAARAAWARDEAARGGEETSG